MFDEKTRQLFRILQLINNLKRKLQKINLLSKEIEKESATCVYGCKQRAIIYLQIQTSRLLGEKVQKNHRFHIS